MRMPHFSDVRQDERAAEHTAYQKTSPPTLMTSQGTRRSQYHTSQSCRVGPRRISRKTKLVSCQPPSDLTISDSDSYCLSRRPVPSLIRTKGGSNARAGCLESLSILFAPCSLLDFCLQSSPFRC